MQLLESGVQGYQGRGGGLITTVSSLSLEIVGLIYTSQTRAIAGVCARTDRNLDKKSSGDISYAHTCDRGAIPNYEGGDL